MRLQKGMQSDSRRELFFWEAGLGQRFGAKRQRIFRASPSAESINVPKAPNPKTCDAQRPEAYDIRRELAMSVLRYVRRDRAEALAGDSVLAYLWFVGNIGTQHIRTSGYIGAIRTGEIHSATPYQPPASLEGLWLTA